MITSGVIVAGIVDIDCPGIWKDDATRIEVGKVTVTVVPLSTMH